MPIHPWMHICGAANSTSEFALLRHGCCRHRYQPYTGASTLSYAIGGGNNRLSASFLEEMDLDLTLSFILTVSRCSNVEIDYVIWRIRTRSPCQLHYRSQAKSCVSLPQCQPCHFYFCSAPFSPRNVAFNIFQLLQ